MHMWIIQYKLLKLNEILCANTFEFNLRLTVFSCPYICCTKYPISLSKTPLHPIETHLYLHLFTKSQSGMGLNKCSIHGMNSHTHYMLVKPLNFNFLTHNIGIHVRCFVHSQQHLYAEYPVIPCQQHIKLYNGYIYAGFGRKIENC